MKKILLLVMLLSVFSFSDDVFFKNNWTLWKDAEILIWTIEKEPSLDPKEFCLSLKRNNPEMGTPKCRFLGEWTRDSIAMRYANWLLSNLEKGIKQEHLKARHPSMVAKLASVEDKLVLFVGQKEKLVHVATFDENKSEPISTGIFENSGGKINLGDRIASEFFSGSTKRRLTKQERLKKQTEPDDMYKEVPGFHGWAGISVGYSQAKIPLTPDNWYDSHINSKIKNYRNTKDSVSLWNFLDDSGPQFMAYLGGTWYGFIGAELLYRYSYHKMKIDETDTIYKELSHWGFSQHEFGLNVLFSRNYEIKKWFEITPFFFLGFQYSVFSEDIALKDDVKEPSKPYKVRIQFEDAYKGALIGFGSHFIFFKNYGLGLRAGLSSRGRNIDVDPSPDAAAEPTTIGASTIDCFVNLGLEYHFSH